MNIKRSSIGQVCWCVLLGVSVLFGLSGCAEVQKGANMPRIDSDNIDTTNPRSELVLASKTLVGKLVVTNVRFGTVGNFQRAEVGLQNISNKKLAFEYKIEWQDRDGFTVNAHASWHCFTLTPGQIQNVQSVGKTEEAYRIQVVVRIPDDEFNESSFDKK